ncbi:MAG: hypothetical protein U9R79_05840 [Armatimonadota bacterium]|nr:hypothetical protein [Armatimonadota bacterium]
MTRRVFGTVVWLAAGVLMLAGLWPAVADVEPNNERHHAEQIQPGSHEGHVGADEDEVDWYGFAVRGGDIMHVSMTMVEGGADVEMRLRDHEGSGLESVRPEGKPELTVITRVELGERTWYLEVSDEGPYQFALQITHQNDAGQGQDAPKERDQALAIQPGETEGLLGDDDEYDAYSFAVQGGDIVHVTIADVVGGADVDLHLLNQEGGGLDTVRPEGDAEVTVITPAELGEQTWYLVAYDEGPYQFTLEITHQDDAGQGRDAPGERDQALAIQPGVTKGLLGDDDEFDSYSFAVHGGDIVRVTIADVVGGADVELHLLNQEGGGLATVRPEEESEVTWLTPTELGEQTWYLSAYGEGPYRFTLQVVPQDDAGQGTDAPEARHRALQVQPGEIRGSVGDDDEWDCYGFEVAPGQTVEVTLTADFARFDREMNWVEATVRDAEGSGKGGLRSAGAAQPDTFREGPLEIEQPQQWTVTVGWEGDYVIDLRIIGAEGADLQRVEQVSAIDWEVLTPVEDQQVQVEPEEETTEQRPVTHEVEEAEPAQQPIEAEEGEAPIEAEEGETPVEDLQPVEGPVYARLVLDSVYCRSESEVDRATDSDEPYFIISGYATHREPAAWSTGEPKVFSDVDDHENRRFEEPQRVVFEGEVPEGCRLGFTVLAMESDDWSSETRARLAQRVAEQTRLAVTGSAEAAISEDLGGESMWEQPETVGWDPITYLASWYLDNLGELINWLVGDDDRVASAGVNLSHDEIATWRGRSLVRDMPTVVLDGGDEGHYGIRWHIEFEPDLTRTIEARFTRWDELAVGNLVGGPEAEILTACDDDASGDNGKFRVHSGEGNLLGSFEAFFTHYDHVAVGDVMGTGHDQVVVASDDHGGMVNIYTAAGQQLYSFPASFDHYYGLAVGNVLGDARDDILIARWRDETVAVFDGHGEELSSFTVPWDFRGTRYTDDTTRHDAFLVGNVVGDEHAEIVMIENNGGRDSVLFIYDSGGNAQPVNDAEVFFTRFDAAALADIDGDGKCELLLAADTGTGGPGCYIDVHELPSGSKSEIRDWPILTRCDGFAAGDVMSVGADQIIVATDEDDRIYVTR